MAKTAEIPAGRRKLERGEHLFVTRRRKRCRAHLWSRTSRLGSGDVVACMVCGKLRQGETMPAGWEPILP